MGYKYRPHSADFVRTHIEHLRDVYRIDFIHFEDDNFTHDLERYDEVLDILLSLSPRIKWDTPNGVRADSWNYERIRKTKESGCQYLVIAIESSVQRVIDQVVKKKLDLSKVEPVMQACKQVGLQLSAFYVLGLPGETAAEIRSNVDYAIDKYRKYDVYPTFSMANPLPGTELHDTVVANNLFHGVTVNDPPRANSIKTDEFDPEWLGHIYDEALRRKMFVTLQKMFTSMTLMRYYLDLSMRNTWLFRRIVRSGMRAMFGMRWSRA